MTTIETNNGDDTVYCVHIKVNLDDIVINEDKEENRNAIENCICCVYRPAFTPWNTPIYATISLFEYAIPYCGFTSFRYHRDDLIIKNVPKKVVFTNFLNIGRAEYRHIFPQGCKIISQQEFMELEYKINKEIELLSKLSKKSDIK